MSTFTRPIDPKLDQETRGHVTNQDVMSPLSQDLWNTNLAEWWLRVKGPHPQSHVTDQSVGHVTNQKYFNFIFTKCKAHKLSRVVTRMRRPHPTYVTPQSCLHVTAIQEVVYICSTSSWSSLLKTNWFQMIVTALKMCNLHKESFYGEIVARCLYGKYVPIGGLAQ